MNREEFQKLSKLRRKEAYYLLKVKQYAGAYYLLGYAVECALKACIAKQTKKYDFPDKNIANKSHVHDLEQLLSLAGLREDLRTNNSLMLNWSIVKDWNETKRYERNISPSKTKDFYFACTSRKNGVLSWIKTKW